MFEGGDTAKGRQLSSSNELLDEEAGTGEPL